MLAVRIATWLRDDEATLPKLAAGVYRGSGGPPRRPRARPSAAAVLAEPLMAVTATGTVVVPA